MKKSWTLRVVMLQLLFVLAICHASQGYLVSRANNLASSKAFTVKSPAVVPIRKSSSSLLQKTVQIRAGSISSNLISKSIEQLSSSPSVLFNACLGGLTAITLLWKGIESSKQKSNADTLVVDADIKSQQVKSLQTRFLSVFWLLRIADWLQGPYFYEVYSSKIINHLPLSMDMVSKLFLIGFASTGLFGPFMGQFVDTVGRKAGTLLYTILYTLGALSTTSNNLWILMLGRLCGGLGTSLLFSAPEAWLVGEFQRLPGNGDTKWLGQTFGWAYSGDSIVAILAGQIASISASVKGPTGPFITSVAFLATAAVLIQFMWKENNATTSSSSQQTAPPVAEVQTQSPVAKPTIRQAVEVMLRDPKILLLGLAQALFEGAMYIFVLQWPPAIKQAMQSMPVAFQQVASNQGIPFGNIFSCFMASCLLGSTLFSTLQRKKLVSVERSTFLMLLTATASMGLAAWKGLHHFLLLIVSFSLFEICVGMYFPSIGTLRSKYIPDSHRSVIMNLFGIPLNLMVVSVFLSIQSLGMKGAFLTATAALALGSLAMLQLVRSNSREVVQ